MKIGEKVTWVAQGRGRRRKKTGVIVAQVRAGKLPAGLERLEKRHDARAVIRPKQPRGVASYIVKVDTKGERLNLLYWPRVQWLERVTN